MLFSLRNSHTEVQLKNYNTADLSAMYRRLYEIGAVKIDTKKGFKLKHHERFPEAPLSPTYLNLRVPENKGPLLPGDVETIANMMYVYVRKHGIQFEGICGVPKAGEPFAKMLQELIYEEEAVALPLVTLHKDVGEGVRRVNKLLKAQRLPRGCQVLLVDDLITTSMSKLEAAEVLRYEGYKVENCIVLLDREQGGPGEMSKHGIKTHSIVSFTSMFMFYRDDGRISDEDLVEIMKYKHSERNLLDQQPA